MMCRPAKAVLLTDFRESTNNTQETYSSALNILIFVCQVTVFHRR